ncbi:MAG: DUF354 domain-containing protein [Bacteroidales bacterium]|nr:DUF354 domain-containing protein [Bacteroidales bacterium]
MKILIYLGHPAHFHLFKNVILELNDNHHEVTILIKKKDVLEDLLKNSKFPYINIQPKGRKDSKFGIAWGLCQRDFKILWHTIKNRPHLMLGTSTEIAQIGRLMNISSIILNEDDYDIVPLFSNMGYPFASHILSPSKCNNGKWENKSIKYNGFHKLAYLHPNRFLPSKDVAAKYVDTSRPYFLLRFAKLTAHHDKGKTGITESIAQELINILLPFGNIYISSERALEKQFEKYRLQIDPVDIHHVMSFCHLYIGDSQSMAVEAAVLGVPGIRFNDFAGKIGVLEELESKYQLTKGIPTNRTELLFDTVKDFLNNPQIKEAFVERRKKMLSDKIDVSGFLLWFIENYPSSVKIMKENPDYQYQFR